MSEQLLTMTEVRERLRVGRWVLQRLIREDPDFRTIKLFDHRRVMTEDALRDFIRAKEAEQVKA